MNTIVSTMAAYPFSSTSQNPLSNYNRAYLTATSPAPGVPVPQRPAFGIHDLLGLSAAQNVAVGTQGFPPSPMSMFSTDHSAMHHHYGYQNFCSSVNSNNNINNNSTSTPISSSGLTAAAASTAHSLPQAPSLIPNLTHEHDFHNGMTSAMYNSNYWRGTPSLLPHNSNNQHHRISSSNAGREELSRFQQQHGQMQSLDLQLGISDLKNGYPTCHTPSGK